MNQMLARSSATSFWRSLLLCTLLVVAAGIAVAAWLSSGSALIALCLGSEILISLAVMRHTRLVGEARGRQDGSGAGHTIQDRDLVRYVKELEWLRSISQRLSETRTLEEVLDVVYEGVRTGLGYDRVGVNLFDYDAGVFEDCIGTDSRGRKIVPDNRRVTLEPDSPIWRFPGITALLRGAPFYYTTNATAECPLELLYLFDGAPAHNVMVPLRSGEKVSGMISVDNLLTNRPISQEEISPLLTLASQVGMAVENARLLEHERDERRLLATMATTDPLTGLPNRTLLNDRLAEGLRAADRAARTGEQKQPLALLLMDLDRFKEVNDTLGHQAGDWLLQEVAARLRAAVRPSDTVARLGGDEFAILLPQSGIDEALEATRTVLAAIDTPLVLEGQTLPVGASIGISVAPDHGKDGSTLLRCADVAMYVAKRARSGYAIYTADDDKHSPARLSLMGELRQAIAEGGLQLHFQPVMDLRHGALTGVEALVRWRHPIHGILTPDQFIPLAEQTGLITPLTAWVVEEAVRQCAAWRETAALELGVAVNLSVRTLHDVDLPEIIGGALRRHGLEPGRLTVEIAERALMADPARALDVLTQLSDLGVRIAIDNFGTGYSSLAYLKDLSVDVIKIDRSFVGGMHTNADPKHRAIVQSTIGMAQILGLMVVAEGVETRETLTVLEALGCDAAQGYYLSRPLPALELERWAEGLERPLSAVSA